MDLETEKVSRHMERLTTIRDSWTVDIARQVIENDPNDIGAVVDDNGVLQGVLAVSDLIKAPDLKDKLDKTLKEAGLHTKGQFVVKCRADDTVESALSKMDAANVKASIVVDDHDRPVGALSRRGLRQSAIAQFKVKL